MNKAFTVLTVIYGLFWLIFGLNGFVHFFPIPEPAGEAGELMTALTRSGYIIPLVYGSEIAGGILLLSLRFVPLGLLILAPVVFNILLYDLFLNPKGLFIGIILTAIHALLLWRVRPAFYPILKPSK